MIVLGAAAWRDEVPEEIFGRFHCRLTAGYEIASGVPFIEQVKKVLEHLACAGHELDIVTCI